jgi:hypothetical protein
MEDNETDDDAVATHSHWLQHPYSQKLRREMGERQQNMLHELMGACEKTTDPKVAAAHARYLLGALYQSVYQPRRGS